MGAGHPWFAAISSFFALHFGNFGGAPVRWSYFALGLAGAFLFYSGNLLWIESRRKKERKSGAVEQTRSTRILGALTVGVPLGCIAGISVTIAAAKWLPGGVDNLASWHSRIYYAVFLLAIFWALGRGAARSGVELLWATALATALIPIASLTAFGTGELRSDAALLVEFVAVLGAGLFAMMARAARRRSIDGPRDSVWSATKSQTATV